METISLKPEGHSPAHSFSRANIVTSAIIRLVIVLGVGVTTVSVTDKNPALM